MKKFKPWMKEVGFRPKAAKFAESALPHALALMAAAPKVVDAHSFAQAVLVQAWFMHLELPRRSKAFQRRYKKENGFT